MEGGRNSQLSQESKDKMSKVRKGRTQTKEWIDKRIAKAGSENAKKYGKEKTEKEKIILSKNSAKYWQGKSRDQETKDKISKNKKGHVPPNRKPVFMIEKGTNLLLAMFNSTSEAAVMNPNYSQSKISRICNNKVKCKENFTFSFNYQS